MTARVGASHEVLKHHVAAHRAAGCPSERPDPTECDRCGEVLLLSCSDCRLPLLIAATAPCNVTGGVGMVPFVAPPGVAA